VSQEQSDTPPVSLPVRIAAAAALICVGLALAGWTGYQAEQGLGLSKVARYGLQALILSALVVPGVWWLRTRVDRRPMSGLKLATPRTALLAFGLGMGIVLVPTIVTGLLAGTLGWATVTLDLSSAALLKLLIAAATVFFFEALPEELVFRGYIYRTLNGVAPKWAAGAITTALFVATPVCTWLIARYLLRIPFGMGGSDGITVGYLSMILAFGLFTQYLRILTGVLWTSMGFHFAFILLNRVVGPRPSHLLRFTDVTAGGPLQMTPLILMLIILVGLLAYPWLAKKPIGWGARDPE